MEEKENTKKKPRDYRKQHEKNGGTRENQRMHN